MTDEETLKQQQEASRRDVLAELVRDASVLRELANAAVPPVDDTALLCAALIASARRVGWGLEDVADALKPTEITIGDPVSSDRPN